MPRAPSRPRSIRVHSRSVGGKEIPTVGPWYDIREILAFRRDPLAFLRSNLSRHGDIFRFHLMGTPMVVVSHPDYIRHILVDGSERYDKNAVIYKVVRPILRNGLIGNADMGLWRRQRRMMAPHFTPRTVSKFTHIMTGETVRMLERWERDPGVGGMLDIPDEIGQLALRIVNRSLFSAEVGETAQAFERAFGEANKILGAFLRFPFPPLSVPTPRHRRLRQAIGEMDEFVSGFIRKRLGDEVTVGEETDLLTLLMRAVDSDDGTGMNIEQLHHEVLNICIGSYDTTTTSLSWAFYVLARYPEVGQKLHAEVDRVLGSRLPDFEDLPKLTYTRMVVEEILRMYSPAFQFMRRAREEDEVGGYRVPAGTNILFNSYFLHRHPDFWDEPEHFDPERFTPERAAGRPNHTYIPFGAGPRICIGKHFALAETTLVLATVARGHRLVLPAGAPEVRPEAFITLHPGGGVHLRLEHR